MTSRTRINIYLLFGMLAFALHCAAHILLPILALRIIRWLEPADLTVTNCFVATAYVIPSLVATFVLELGSAIPHICACNLLVVIHAVALGVLLVSKSLPFTELDKWFTLTALILCKRLVDRE